jgi:hypothetical protein
MLLSTALQKLLDKLLSLCPNDGYEVIDWAELDGEQGTVLPQLNELADLELVKIKYNDDNVVCVAVTPTGRVLEGKAKINAAVTKRSTNLADRLGFDLRTGIYFGLAVFSLAFLGGFLGALLGGMF